jgi:hypothetical protein
MIQDSTKNFLFKSSTAPSESPSFYKEKKEIPGRDSVKIKYIEKYVPKAAKRKEVSKNKEASIKKTAKPNAPVISKTKEKKKAADLHKEKKKISTQEADSVFRFNDIESNAPAIKPSPSDTFKPVSPIFLNAGNKLKPEHTHPLPSNKENTDWIFFTLLISCGAFIWVKVFYRKIFEQIVQAFFNNRITNQIVRDENILIQKASVLLTIIFNLVFSLFLYKVSTFFEWNPDYLGSGFNRFLVFALAVSFIYTIKLLTLKVIGNIFKIDKAIAVYIFNIFLINNLLGIALIPVLIFVSFSKLYTLDAIYLGLGLTALSFFYRIVRGWLIGLTSSGFSLLYLFLYLCALEIAPLLVFYKLLTIKSF